MAENTFLIAQARVKEGMISVPGRNSSRKLNPAPSKPFQPPNIVQKIREEMGAQIISAHSPMRGMAYVVIPMMSISTQKTNEGAGFLFVMVVRL